MIEFSCTRCGSEDHPLCDKCRKQDQFDEVKELLRLIIAKLDAKD